MTELELELFQNAVQGNTEAFGQLIINYEKLIYSIAYRMFNNPEDARDMAQESIFKAYRNIKKCKEPAAFKSWLCRIATNTCLDELRKRKNKRADSLDAAMETDEGEVSLQVAGTEPGPEETVLKQETIRQVQKAIEALPHQHRIYIVLRDMEGLSYEEISQVMETPLGTVKSKIARARSALKSILEKGREQI